MNDGRAAFRAFFPDVSHETLAALDQYVALLLRWQKTINLIGPSTQAEIWQRHIVDSYQLLQLAPQARHWIDLGSGGGLPGIVIAIAMREVGGSCHLVESNLKKAAFLRHVSTEFNLPAQIHAGRIEVVLPTLDLPDIVTARALASMDALLAFSNLLLKSRAVGLFPKGRDVQRELTEAQENWQFECELIPSMTDSKALIARVSHVTPRIQQKT